MIVNESRDEKKTCLERMSNDMNGWIICIVNFVSQLIRGGVVYTFGLYIAELRKLYGVSMAQLNWIPVIIVFMMSTFSSLCIPIIRRLPKHGYMVSSVIGTLLQSGACISSSFINQVPWLFLTYGVMFGLGSSLTILSSTLVLSNFFPSTHKYHVVATSIFQSSFPAGILIFSAAYAYVIETYSWRWAMRITGIKIFVTGMICSILLILQKPDQESNSEEDEIKKKTWRQYLDIVRKAENICWLIGIILIFACCLVAVNILPHYMELRGYTVMESSMTIIVIGVSELLILLVVPFLGIALKGNLLYANILSCLGLAILFYIWPSVDSSYGIVLVLSAVNGIFGALSYVFMYPASGEVMDVDVGVAWTATVSVMGLGSLMGPFISGIAYDLSNSYDVVLYVLASANVANFLAFAAIPVIKYFKQKPYERLE